MTHLSDTAGDCWDAGRDFVVRFSPMRLSCFLCLLLALGVSGGAQTISPGVFHDKETGVTMRYPVEFVVRDAQQAMEEGHIAAFGSLQNQAKEHQLVGRCIRPILLADYPHSQKDGVDLANFTVATFFMFEFLATKECKAGFKYKDDERVAGGIAQTAMHVPGGTPLSPPLWFDLGKEKLHATFAAIGLQNTSPGQPHLLLVTAAMRYHGRIICWLLSAAQLNTFNDLTKSSVELDDGKIYPLVPFNLDDQLRLPIRIMK